jgi:tetratricopeptide (TPR) repeat protein
MLVTAAVYAPTLSYDFVFDDHGQILENSYTLNWEWAPRYFTSPLWGFKPETVGVYYRPVFMLWLLSNYQLFGPEPAWWHLTSILSHLLCTLLVYSLARHWMDQVWSGIAALLFGVHPVHVEGVAWISGVSEPLLGIFFLGSILCYLRWRTATADGGRGWIWLAASAGLYVLAMLEKETAVVLPGIILAYEMLFRRGSNRSIAPLLALYPASAAAYLLVRLHIVPGLMRVLKPMPISVVVATWPSMLLFYLKQLIWPVSMSEFHYLPYVTYLSVRRLVLPVVFLSALTIALAHWSRKNRVVGFASALLVIPILPVLDFRAFVTGEVVHDRYLYLSSVGFCLLVVLAWKHLIPRISVFHLVSVLAIIGLLSYRTVRESAFWHDDLLLFQRAYEVAPQHPMASENLAVALLVRGQPVEALPYFEHALSLGARNPDVVYGMGRAYFGLEDWDRAADCFQRALRGNPKSSVYLLFAGLSDFHLGRLQNAEAEIREAIRIRSSIAADLSLYHLALGDVLEKQGNLRGALAEYAVELEQNPNSERAQEQSRKLRRLLSQH